LLHTYHLPANSVVMNGDKELPLTHTIHALGL